jgi:FMN phosphatase YigB (HAD superfamily)
MLATTITRHVPPASKQVDAVLFDFAGTLFMPQPAARQVALAAKSAGLRLTSQECECIAARFERVGMPGGPYPASIPADLRALYAERDLGPDAHRAAYTALMSTAPAPEGLAGAVYERIRLPEGWVAYRDTHATIAVLVERGVAVGVVSNVGFDIRPILIAHGMDQLALHATLSFEVNAAKPAPEIFRSALAGLAAAPARTLMVGDHPVADGGAAAVGIQTLILPMSPPGTRHGLDRVIELVLGVTPASLDHAPAER